MLKDKKDKIDSFSHEIERQQQNKAVLHLSLTAPLQY